MTENNIIVGVVISSIPILQKSKISLESIEKTLLIFPISNDYLEDVEIVRIFS